MTNIFDLRTIFISYSISNAICALVMAFLWLQNRKRSPELRFWLASFVMQFLAVLLITLRGFIPDFLSIVVANTLAILGSFLIYLGLEWFFNEASSQRHNYILLVLFFFVHTYFTYTRPSLLARTINFSFAMLLLCIQSAWLMLYRVEERFRLRTWKVGVLFVAFSLINLAHILASPILPRAADLFHSGLFDTLVILSFQMLYIALSFGLFLLVNRRLVSELENDLIERKRIEESLQQRLTELETVNALSISLRAGKSLEQLLQILLQETLKAVTVEDGCILLLNPENGKLNIAETRGWFHGLPDLSLDPSEGAAGFVFITNETYLSDNVQDDLFNLSQARNFTPPPARGVFLPIRDDHSSIGLLVITFPPTRTLFENELRLLSIISRMAGIAISRCGLHDQIKSFNVDLQREIQQRITVQKLLAAEKELLSTTLMSIADGVIVTNEHGRVILFNRAAETITGYTESEAVKEPIGCVFRLDQTTGCEPSVINFLFELENRQKNQISYKPPQIITKAGDRILVSGGITPLKSANEAAGFVVVFQNVSEKQKAEAQNMLSQKMEAIGQLAAGIAHEINTPIQYIGDNLKFVGKANSKYSEILTAYQQVIEEHLEKALTCEDLDQLNALSCQKKLSYYLNETPKAIQESLDGIERVRKIVLAMREFSHPSEKGKKFSDINHGIETTAVISRNEWKYCAEMELQLDRELPPVYCQIDEINQVILNLIVNAAQAIQEKTPTGSGQKGKILVSTCQRADKVIITIQDTGCGIRPEIRDRIFDPFFTTKGVGKGTGQGLSMAHNIIVKKHHGTINVDSKPGQGTSFTIEIPIDSSQPEQL